MVQRGLDLLRKHVCQGALHNSKERAHLPRRHPGTRVKLVDDIKTWLDDVDDPCLILWLKGLDGFGKSVIAESIASHCYEEGRLLGGFFVSDRTPMETHQNDDTRIAPTIAHQMEQNPHLRLSRLIGGVVEENPLVFGLNLPTQVEKLIVDPLSLRSDEMACKIPPVLIILDGLDQLPNKGSQTQVVEAFSKAVVQAQHQIPIKLLLCSRAQHAIQSAVMAPQIASLVRTISLETDHPADEDIRTFLIDEFREFRRTHPSPHIFPTIWPTDSAIDKLVERASGRFSYASTILDYVRDESADPIRRLSMVLGPSANSWPINVNNRGPGKASIFFLHPRSARCPSAYDVGVRPWSNHNVRDST
ncbi:hypothetical protein BDN70DRAFT_888865 [Pholiota conissans]|uniref:Nephrocystin 3-like N-terminal domain-containing protein n=1 Tax=Pholiota conissans TaxID=109636 RepID=A0A9P6CLH7_9AGAR|nr:hypothetical protein BDN70DRAFT_888865 [Pholiota conissans]